MSVLTKGFRKYTMNPALGFLPIALLPMGSLLDVDSQWLFIAATAFSIGIDVYCRKVLQTQIFSIITVASVISLLLAMAFYLSLGHRFEQAWAYVVFCEVSLVLLFFAVRQSKKYIGTHYFSRSDMRENSLLRDFSEAPAKALEEKLGGIKEILQELQERQSAFNTERVAYEKTLCVQGAATSASVLKKPLLELLNAKLLSFLTAMKEQENYRGFAAGVARFIDEMNETIARRGKK